MSEKTKIIISIVGLMMLFLILICDSLSKF